MIQYFLFHMPNDSDCDRFRGDMSEYLFVYRQIVVSSA